MDRRDRYPESSLWETPEGRAWLIRLVGATLLEFGLKRGVGAETLSEFFSRLHLEEQVACSPNTLRTVLHLLERLILEITAAWEKDGIAHGEIRPVIGAVDETFLQQMMLVFMDLATGYLLVEEVAADRRYDTWFNRTNERLKTFGTEVLYMVSDRAKALIKLAHTGLGCPSIPDVFHLGHDRAKGYSLAIFGRLRQAKQALEQAKQGREKVHKHAPAEPDQVVQAQARVTTCATSVHHWQEVGRAWRQHLANVSRILPPWRLVDLDPPDIARGRGTVGSRAPGDRNVARNQRAADEKRDLGQGPKAACRHLGPGGLVVADRTTRFDAIGDDTEVEPVGGRIAVAPCVLARATSPHTPSGAKGPDRARAPGGGRGI